MLVQVALGFIFPVHRTHTGPDLHISGITDKINKNVVKQFVNNVRCIIRPQPPPSSRRDYNGFRMLGLPQLHVGFQVNPGGHVFL